MSAGSEGLKLHLGAFDHIVPGWVNTDITPHLRIARVPGLAFVLHKLGLMAPARYEQHRGRVFAQLRYLDVRRTFPWRDGTFVAAYCSHLLEHLYAEEALHCAREVFRTLASGGVFRIAVPDLDALMKSYDPADPERFLECFFEGRQSTDKNRHHWHYNEALLRKTLLGVGFREAVRCSYREGRCADVEALDTRRESLFMEATK